MLTTSNDLRDVIISKLTFGIPAERWEQQKAKEEANKEYQLAHADSITKFYNHPVWNAGARMHD